MWKQGQIKVRGTTVDFVIKVFEEGSDFGINGGRISKLNIRTGNKELANYDRGWDVKPTTAIGKGALKIILKEYN